MNDSATDRFSSAQRETLLTIAEHAILQGIKDRTRWQPELSGLNAALTENGASFVTLHKQGTLRGCIGSLTPIQPLALDVASNAFNAAFRDPRFPPLQQHEWTELALDLSLIGPSQELCCRNETELLAELEPGRDGLILDDGNHRATFLPSVWEQLPDSSDFVAHLKRKAGLSPRAWPNSLRCYRYRVESFGRGVTPSDKKR